MIACPDQLKKLLVPIDSIKPDPDNPRTGHDVQAIAASLRELGWHSAIVVNAEGTVTIGHGRLEAARTLGETQIPVLQLDDDRAKALARNVADNQTGLLSTWDLEALMKALDVSDLLKDISVDIGLDAFLEKHGVFDADVTTPPALYDGDKSPFSQMTFTLHETQIEQVTDALKAAIVNGDLPVNIGRCNSDPGAFTIPSP